jgi:cell fate regulator YaaT (PSP1 superfamily)
MCCLSYESEFYKEALKKYPELGENIKTEKGMGRVIEINILKKYITIELDDESDVKKRIKISEEELEKITSNKINQKIISDNL